MIAIHIGMAIKNKDGSTYKPSGSLSQLVPDSPTHDLFNLWDQEVIKIGGSPILYYELFVPSDSVDHLYIESRSKMWCQTGVELNAMYEPIGSAINMGPFGADGPANITFLLNYRETIDILGHLPTVGARIFSPHLGEHWEIISRKVSDFHRWKIYRIEVYCERFQENLTTGEGKVTQGSVKPSFQID